MAVVGLAVIACALWLLLSRDENHGATGSAAAPTCTRSRLAARVGFVGAAAGHQSVSVYLTNASRSRCTLDGYPTLQMLTASGRQIPTTTDTRPSYTILPTKARRVSLVPEGSATFFIGVTDTTGGYEDCPTSARVAITLPGNRAPITIALRIAAYSGSVQHTHCGLMFVSPVIAGIHKRD